MRLGPERILACAGLVATLAVAADVRADADRDTTFGRVAGDVSLVAGAGTLVSSHAFRAEGEVRARYLDTAGVFATYEETLVGEADAAPRVITAGFELRPLFLYRWLTGREAGHARWDLCVDSFGLEMGAFFLPDAEAASSSWGLLAGVGLELPIVPQASGLWLQMHGGLRWTDSALGVGAGHLPEDRAFYFGLALAWHQVVLTHAVDAGDPAIQ